MNRSLFLLFMQAAALLALMATGTAHAKLVEEIVDLPVEVADQKGQKIRHTIKVFIFRDDALMRAPFLILNHGRSGEKALRAAVNEKAYRANAIYFVKLGFAVFYPVRVGYGVTAGPDIENSGSCSGKTYRPGYEAAAEQSLAVIELAKSKPWVDPMRGIVVGQSYGGTTAIALAARNVPGVLAAVNFAGGGGGRPKTNPHEPCGIEKMTALFASYGKTAKTPTAWIYSPNDLYWGPDIPRRWFEAFRKEGGKGEFLSLPPLAPDGHLSFSRNRQAWREPFERFLAACCPTLSAPQR